MLKDPFTTFGQGIYRLIVRHTSRRFDFIQCALARCHKYFAQEIIDMIKGIIGDS